MDWEKLARILLGAVLIAVGLGAVMLLTRAIGKDDAEKQKDEENE